MQFFSFLITSLIKTKGTYVLCQPSSLKAKFIHSLKHFLKQHMTPPPINVLRLDACCNIISSLYINLLSQHGENWSLTPGNWSCAHIFFHDLELIIYYRMIPFPEQDNKSISLLTNFLGYFSSILHLWIELSSLNHVDWNNRPVPNRKRSMSRLYIVTLLI